MATPEEHARRAEELLQTADGFRPGQAHYHGLMARAQVHATLSLRAPARKKPGPKPATSARKEADG